MLVLASLALIDADEVASGWGWELVGGVGIATYVAHLYAEVVGDRLRRTAAQGRTEIKRAMADGLPILLAAVPPAVVLGLGRIDVLAGPRGALDLRCRRLGATGRRSVASSACSCPMTIRTRGDSRR